MKFIIKYSTLIRIASLIPFVLVGLMLPIGDNFILYYLAIVFVFGFVHVLLTIAENKYKAINHKIFIRNVILRMIHFIIIAVFSYVIFFASHLHNNPIIALSFIFIAGFSGYYFDYLDTKNSEVIKE
ncbi:hypothetical protein [Mammaliicoccus sciuri]|jgi:magnesium-transporting ATPase (P-type)|uniref:hypothetical protein n=1 Tax=Mammaliicoccus sciuri TaxID=1296 RepID=UPI0008076109|nr:hypothetical protein [Mammaliicoccus sciuri]MCD8772211.1 hypothetical protein [Mammaliicoccus sciuri]MCJ0935989.1 hypothetical protein [Mammaliicoccus sciuri]MCJ0956048.1 hypothetical protein [Mammaliicoccus sciuri]MEB5678062.1 hypothetical protein [Mammaliicoccus sciuri]MEB6200127.1 hypothetical protein [Mammaliicoccus sciuri]